MRSASTVLRVPVEQIPRQAAELPLWRYKNLIWRLMEYAELDEVDWTIMGLAHRPCRIGPSGRRQRQVGATAVLGSDGHYHLMTAGKLACGEPDPTGVVHHSSVYRVFKRDGKYTAKPVITSAAEQAEWESVGREHEWTFTLTDVSCEPSLVHTRERCDRGVWPAFFNPNTKLGKITRTLVEQFGADCHICHRAPGTVVDHDHLTGTVRGLLCADCNGGVEYCAHLAGCGFAEYLNAPPAADLGLHYGKYKKTEADKRKEAMLGVAMNKTPAAIADWHWTPTSGSDYYQIGHDFTPEIARARAIMSTVLRCECGPDADGYDTDTYMGAVTVTRHDLCCGVTDITYRCPQGCQPSGGWSEPSLFRRSRCPRCTMRICWGCARAPRPHGHGDVACNDCKADE